MEKNLVDILSTGGASHVTGSHHTDDKSGVSSTGTFWNLVDRWVYSLSDKIRSGLRSSFDIMVLQGDSCSFLSQIT